MPLFTVMVKQTIWRAKTIEAGSSAEARASAEEQHDKWDSWPECSGNQHIAIVQRYDVLAFGDQYGD
jgi:hypothetical protein